MSLSPLSAFLRLSTVRQTLWLLGVFCCISVVAWGGTYLLIQREMLRTVDARLEQRMAASIAAVRNAQPLPTPLVGETAEWFTERRPDGFYSRDVENRGGEFRFLVRTTEQGRIRLGENTERQEELRDMLAGGMQWSLAATLVITCLVGVWMARRGQARLNTINTGLSAVAAGQLETRIALDGQDDLSLLADRINATTARLDTAMSQMRVQSSNIAHDLRTPLARLRAHLEQSLLSATETAQPVSPEVLGAALEQIDRITGTFDALLRLARIESGAGRDAFAPLSLGALAEQVAEVFGPVVEDAGQVLVLDVTAPASVPADRDLLVQLCANLIQNALRYGAEGQTITLRVHGPRLSISDEGPGIPFAERENVLQPLYQGSSTRQNEGFGLGLSLVRAIADLHGAGFTLSDGPNGRGLRVSLQFANLTEL